MVVYQALYGNCGYWVRPEKMFFERITREGRGVIPSQHSKQTLRLMV